MHHASFLFLRVAALALTIGHFSHLPLLADEPNDPAKATAVNNEAPSTANKRTDILAPFDLTVANSDELQRTELQERFAGGNLQKVFNVLDQLTENDIHTLHNPNLPEQNPLVVTILRFEPPLTQDQLQLILDAEDETINNQLDRLQKAKIHVTQEPISDPIEIENVILDSRAYTLQPTGDPKSFDILRVRLSSPEQFIIIETIDSPMKKDQLFRLLQALTNF